MRAVAVIPARMASSRFPGKPTALIHGIPMIGHCFYRVNMCPDIDQTYVATCDSEIYDYIESIGGKVVMTSTIHERASDRAAEAMSKVEKETEEEIDIGYQGCSLASSRHVCDTKVSYNWGFGVVGDDSWFPDLQR